MYFNYLILYVLNKHSCSYNKIPKKILINSELEVAMKCLNLNTPKFSV